MQFSSHDLRETTAANHIVPVLTPSGGIKWVRVSNTIDSPIVSCEFGKKSGGEVFLKSVRIAQSFEENGWELLETTFSKDGEGWRARWADYLAHMQHVTECEVRGVTAAGFPVELLPDQVLERRRGDGDTAKKWAPQSTAKKRTDVKRGKELT